MRSSDRSKARRLPIEGGAAFLFLRAAAWRTARPLLVGWCLASMAVAALAASPKAADSPPAADSSPAADSPAVDVAETLRPAIRSLSRAIETYHYVSRERMGLPATGYVAPDASILGPYLERKAVRFWNLDAPLNPGAAIGGLYVATDPLAGRSFGGAGDDWAMVRITLAEGFRFLDIRDGGWSGTRDPGRQFPQSIQESLAAAGCEVLFPSDVLLMLERQRCRDIAVEVVRSLDLDGILYSWNRFDFPICNGRADGAFLILNTEGLEDLSRLFTSVASLEDGAVEERQRIRALFERGRRAGSIRQPPWPGMEELPGTEGIEAWMREFLFGCGGHSEDQPSSVALGAGTATSDETVASSKMDYRPGPAADQFWRAKELAHQGQLEQAVQGFEEAMKLDPEYVPAWEELAWILATAPDLELRDPQRAIELAEELVRVTHYLQRRSTVGFIWTDAYKLRCGHTLAVAHASANSFERALSYADWSVAVSGKMHRDLGTPETARFAEESQHLLQLFQARQPFVPLPGFERTEVVWREW